MPINLSELTFTEAAQRLEGRRSKCGADYRKFFDGDHWQGGAGFIGEKPPKDAKGYADTMAQIEAGFQPENVVAEVVGRHRDGVLGREPTWDFIPAGRVQPRVRARTLLRARRQTARPPEGGAPSPAPAVDPRALALMEEADPALVEWWDEQELLLTLQEACETVLLEEKAVLRFYITGERGEGDSMAGAGSLAEAFALLRVEVVTPDKGGVFTDPDTGKRYTVFHYEKDSQKFVELSYLDAEGNTVLRVLDSGGNVVSEAKPPYRLGGRLLMCEVKRKPIITEPVIRNQKALNLSNTMMQRNINMAGSRERYFFNTQRPGRYVPDPTAPGGERFVEEALKLGPGRSIFPPGIEIRDEKTNELKGYANPNLQVLEPVEVDSFTGTRDHFYAAILGQCWQRHALISGDATASGRSREQARAEFEKSLSKTKTSFDAAGRWLLETALRLAADLAGRAGDFEALRAEFNTIVDAGPIDPEDRAADRADVEGGLMSDETYMVRRGDEDPDAERARIESQPPRQQAPQDPPNQDPPAGGGQ